MLDSPGKNMAEAHALMKLMKSWDQQTLLLSRKGDITGILGQLVVLMELAWAQGGLIPATRKEPGSPSHVAGHMWRQKLHLVWVMHLLISSQLNFLTGPKKWILLTSHSCSIQVEFFLVTCLVLKSGSEILGHGASALLILCLFLLWWPQNLYKMAHTNVFDWTFTWHWRDWGAWRYPWASHLTTWCAKY